MYIIYIYDCCTVHIHSCLECFVSTQFSWVVGLDCFLVVHMVGGTVGEVLVKSVQLQLQASNRPVSLACAWFLLGLLVQSLLTVDTHCLPEFILASFCMSDFSTVFGFDMLV